MKRLLHKVKYRIVFVFSPQTDAIAFFIQENQIFIKKAFRTGFESLFVGSAFFVFPFVNPDYMSVYNAFVGIFFRLHSAQFRIAFFSVFHSVFVIVHKIFLSLLQVF